MTGAIVGARRPDQAESWLPAADLELTAQDLEKIERALAETGAGTAEPPAPPNVSSERQAAVAGAPPRG